MRLLLQHDKLWVDLQLHPLPPLLQQSLELHLLILDKDLDNIGALDTQNVLVRINVQAVFAEVSGDEEPLHAEEDAPRDPRVKGKIGTHKRPRIVQASFCGIEIADGHVTLGLRDELDEQ